MMMKHKSLKTLAALWLCLTLAVGPFPAQAVYADVSGDELKLATATLTSLDILSGYPDGGFHPEDGLDRGQFCKLAVLAGGYGDQLTVSAYQTVFDDVPAGHWAASYINLACSLGLVSGYGNGSFGPNDPVTLGQAAKVLLALLGYTTEEVGPFFPEDYLTRAAALGLTEGMAQEDAPLTRGDAALLLYRLLTLPTKEGKDFYAQLGHTVVEDVVLLDGEQITVTDGRAIQDYSVSTSLDTALEGRRGALLLDKAGLVCGFVPQEDKAAIITISVAEADYITADTGRSYELDETVAVVWDEELTTYQDVWFSLGSGDRVTLYLAAGKVSLLVVAPQEHAAGNQVAGRLESASPSLRRATTVTVQGATLAVNDWGREALAACSVGDIVQVTLDRAGKVDDVALTTNAANVGLLTINGNKASVSLPGATISGTLATSATNVSPLSGSLVRARVNTVGELSISTLATQSPAASLDVTARTLGSAPLSTDVTIYERVGSAPAQAISLDDILTPTVAAKDIEYVGYNAAGEVNLLLLQDVTGNGYAYGKLLKDAKTVSSGQMSATNTTVTVENSDNDSTAWITGASFKDESFGGVAKNAVTGKAAAVVTLTAVEGLTRADFSGNTLANIPIANKVQVYDAATERWITLSQAQAYAATFTAYYDRTPDTGGQVRVIVAEN